MKQKWLDLSSVDYDFMGWRAWFIGASALFCLATVVAVFWPGPNYGTDFQGGTEVEIEFKQPVAPGLLRASVAEIGFAAPDVVAVGGAARDQRYLVKVREVSVLDAETQAAVSRALCLVPEEGELTDPACPKGLWTEEVKFSPGGDKIAARYVESPCQKSDDPTRCSARADIARQLAGKVAGVRLRAGAHNPVVQNPRDHRVEFHLESKGDQIMTGLRAKLGPDVVPDAPLRSEWLGPKAGKQLRDAAIVSIALSLVFIMAYVAFRFDIRFAPGGVIALIHDALMALGAMILTGREVTLSTVAALLTIIGFSINDTVVIYDRVRENLGKYRRMSFPMVINRSISEMLSRTIRTSVTVFLSLVPFLFWGTGTIQDFAFTMLVGTIAGVYSTIYIALPATEWIDRKFFGRTVRKKRRRVVRKAAGGGAGVRPRRYGDAVI